VPSMRACLRSKCVVLSLSFLAFALIQGGDTALTAAIGPSRPVQSTGNVEKETLSAAGVAFTLEATSLPQTAFGVAEADFNGDGKSDLATIDSSGISIWLGNGDGTFRAGPVYPLSQCVFIATADFNRDGHPDLAVTRANGALAILLGNGDGSFKSPVDYAVGAGPQGLAIGDFNGDGIPDVAVANAGLVNGTYTGNTVSVLLGNGDGTFRAQEVFTTAQGPLSVAAADLNGTGDLDLAVATAGSFGTVSVLRGNGDGTFQLPEDYPSSKNPDAEARTILAADLNGDGTVDFAVVDETPNKTGASIEISILFGSSDGTWQQGKTYDAGSLQDASGAASDLSRIVLADLDGDGKLDLISIGPQVSVQLGNGDGSFGSPVLYPISGGTAGVAADFDGDGFLDLAIAGRSMTILRNSPTAVLSGASGVFPARQVHTVSSPVTAVLSNPNHLALRLSGLQITGDFSQSSDCGNELAPGAQCSIAIRFSPQAAGTRSGELSIFDASGRSMSTLALSGQGTTDGPVVTLSASSLTFTQVRVATHQTQTVQLTNTGNSALSITSISITGTGQFSQTNNCGASVAAASSCTITVTFSPSFPETQTGAVSISDDAPGSPQSVALTGSGESLAFSKTNLNFQPVFVGQTSASLQTVTLFNVGPGVVTFTAVTIGGTNAGDFQWLPSGGPQPSCPLPGVLRANSHCYLSFSFAPSAAGARTALLSVSDDRDPFPATLAITGVGNPAGPIASFSALSISFGVVLANSRVNEALQLTNPGNQTLTISSISITGTGQFLQINDCGTSLAPGKSCSFNLIFSPGSGGAQTGTLDVIDNAPDSPQMIQLSGTGQNIEFNKTSLVFATEPMGQTSPGEMVSVFSLAGNPIIIGSLSGPDAGDFQVVSSSCGMFGLPAEIRIGDPCKLELVFIPSGTGLRTAQLTFMNENSVSGPAIVLPLSGMGLAAPMQSQVP